MDELCDSITIKSSISYLANPAHSLPSSQESWNNAQCLCVDSEITTTKTYIFDFSKLLVNKRNEEEDDKSRIYSFRI